MELIEVNTKDTARVFLDLASSIYALDKNWIRPLDKDIEDVFNKKTNKYFRFGTAQRWILLDEKGLAIGRIAAFVNKRYKNKGDEFIVGGIGFFECINNQYAANQLLDRCQKWLSDNGMEAMDGPINFGDRDRWWGMLTEGFSEPSYGMNYNPPYYVTLFENYGFQIFYNQICFGLNFQTPLKQKIFDRHAIYATKSDFSFKHLRKEELEKFASDFLIVYNKAYAGHGGMKELSKEQVNIMFKKMKYVMDERIVWYAYFKNEPIAIFINIPDLNQWFRHLNGKFGAMQKLYFLWLKMVKKNKKFNGLVFAIVPEWQGKGVDAYIIVESYRLIKTIKIAYVEYEMQWVGDFNPKMINLILNLGESFKSRNLVTYRFQFDKSKEFKRHPTIN